MASRIVIISSSPVAGLDAWIRPGAKSFSPSPLPPTVRYALPKHTANALQAVFSSEGGVSAPHLGSVAVWPSMRTEEPAAGLGPLGWIEPVALRLVVASVNGMQRLTLRRCLKLWVMLYGWTPGWRRTNAEEDASRRRARIEDTLKQFESEGVFDSFVARLLELHTELLTILPGEVAPGLSAEVRALGLDRQPMISTVSKQQADRPVSV